jgi:hypothetical protein
MQVSLSFSYSMLLKRGPLHSMVGLLLASVLLISCSGLNFGGSTASDTSTLTNVALAKLHWCGKVLMIFRDEGATSGKPSLAGGTTGATVGTPTTGGTSIATSTATTATPTTLTDWNQVEKNLGFTPYLPPTLPSGTCLVSAYGMIHDPILGGSFTIGYLLPDHSAVTLSEAPLGAQNKNTQFQCNVTTNMGAGATKKEGTPVATPGKTQLPLQVCTGARATTSIVFSARGTKASLQQFFNALQPDVNWIPAAS